MRDSVTDRHVTNVMEVGVFPDAMARGERLWAAYAS